MMTQPLTGIVPPLITPLQNRDALDEPGLERLIEHVLRGGVSGLFILGTTGEGPSLSYRLRREFVERTCRQVGGRVPVLVGITDTAVVEAVGLARFAADAGAAALVAAPPYYLPGGQPELREYLGHLVRELPLPLFLYNMPALTKVPFDLETVRVAMDNPRIVGLKDSSGDMAYFQGVVELLPNRPDWSLLIGPEERLLDAVLARGARRCQRGRQSVSDALRRAIRSLQGPRRRPRVPPACAGASRQLVAVPDRAASLGRHQGHQVRPLLRGCLRRLHGRALSPVPRERAGPGRTAPARAPGRTAGARLLNRRRANAPAGAVLDALLSPFGPRLHR